MDMDAPPARGNLPFNKKLITFALYYQSDFHEAFQAFSPV
jgi:hypothetical protein